MAATSIGYQLGIGSGLDIKSLVDNLAAAAKAPKEAQIAKREEANAAKVSQLAQVSQGIDSFASRSVLADLAAARLFSQPSVSDPSVLSATALPRRAARRPFGLDRGHPSRAGADACPRRRCRRAPIRSAQGDLTLATRDRLVQRLDHRRQRQARRPRQGDQRRRRGRHRQRRHRHFRRPAGAEGRDRRRQRLHPVGAERHRYRARALRLRPRRHRRHDRGAAGAQRRADRRRRRGRAGDEQLQRPDRGRADRPQARRARQCRSRWASPGPTRRSARALSDFVAAYNELMTMMTSATAAGVDGEAGALRGDLGVREMRAGLARLPTMALSSEGDGPHTLAEIGVRTNRDGTPGARFEPRCASVLASDPDGVEALFNPGQRSSSPLLDDQQPGRQGQAGHLHDHRCRARRQSAATPPGKVDGAGDARRGRQPRRAGRLGGARPGARRQRRGGERDDHGRRRPRRRAAGAPRFAARPQRAVRRLAATGCRPRPRPSPRTARRSRRARRNITTSCSTSFTAMERQVSAFKATQSYLEQQVKMWTGDRD